MDQRKEDKEKEKQLVFQLQILSPSDKDMIFFFLNILEIGTDMFWSVEIEEEKNHYTQKTQAKPGAALQTQLPLRRCQN